MSRKSKGLSKGTAQASASEKGSGALQTKPPRLTPRQRVKLAQETRDKVYRQASAMIEKMIADVTKKGSHTTAKFLFEFAGIDEIPLNEKQRKQAEDSLAAYLLKKLDESAQKPETNSVEGGAMNLHLTQ